MFLLVHGTELGGIVATQVTQVTMEDGSEASLLDHLRDGHHKGIRGFTKEYLANLHQTLHQRNHEPDPEHIHPGSEEPAQELRGADPAAQAALFPGFWKGAALACRPENRR